jgi:two-component system CheB/CheR fusion protein
MTAAPQNPPTLRILVVEDHSDSLELLRIYLEYCGYVVLSARSKTEALKEMPTADCDVLLSNIGLPDGNGWDLIKEAGKLRPRYAIAMSGFGMEADCEFSGNGMTLGTFSAMLIRDIISGKTDPWNGLFAPNRKATVGTWDYVLENKDFPTYFIKDWIGSPAPTEDLRPGSGQVEKIDGKKRAVYCDEQGNHWRVYIFIEGARTFDVVESARRRYCAVTARAGSAPATCAGFAASGNPIEIT